MKVFLDDMREAPEGWIRCYKPEDCITLLKTGEVTHISLDHDLGNDNIGTGYDVLLWIEKAVFTEEFVPPIMTVHSANVSARAKMEQCIEHIWES